MAYTPETVFVDKLPQICVNLELISVYDVACKSIPELLYLLSQKINATLTTVEHNDKALEAAVNELKVKLDAYIEVGLTDEVIDILDKLDKDGWFDAIIDERLDEKLGNLSESNVIAEIIKARDGFTTLGARVAKAGYVFDTIADLQAIIRDTPLADGTVVEVLGYYAAGDGAGHKRIIASVDDGSGVAVGNKFANYLEGYETNVKHFGAKGDYSTDDTEAIQKAINFSKRIVFPSGKYKVSKLIISKIGQELIGEGFVLVESNTTTETLLQINSESNANSVRYLTIENIEFDGANKVQNIIKTNEFWAVGIRFKNVRTDNSLNYGMYLNGWQIEFDSCTFARGRVGVALKGLSGTLPTTATFKDCYANACSEIGYDIEATYSSMINCACDHVDVGYQLKVKGFSMISCGAEGTKQLINSPVYCDGLNIQGFYGLANGQAGRYLFNFNKPIRTTISGVSLNSTASEAKQVNIGVVSDGNEMLTVLDNSFKYEDITLPTTIPAYAAFNKPVKFLVETDKNQTFNINASEITDLVKKLNYRDFKGNLTVNITGSTSTQVAFKHINCDGIITISGEGVGTTNLGNITFENCSNVILDKLTVLNQTSSTSSANLTARNTSIYISEVELKNEQASAGSAVYAYDFSSVEVRSVAKTTGAFSTGSNACWRLASGANIVFAKSSGLTASTITNKFYDVGNVIYNSNPQSGSKFAWVCVSKGYGSTDNFKSIASIE